MTAVVPALEVPITARDASSAQDKTAISRHRLHDCFISSYSGIWSEVRISQIVMLSSRTARRFTRGNRAFCTGQPTVGAHGLRSRVIITDARKELPVPSLDERRRVSVAALHRIVAKTRLLHQAVDAACFGLLVQG